MKYGEIEFKGQNIYQHWEINIIIPVVLLNLYS